jgi:hypothetical protein
MTILEFSQDQLIMAAAALAFVLGVLVACVVFSSRVREAAEDPRNHLIRQLEADLRLVERQREEALAALDNRDSDYETSMATIHDLNGVLADREEQVGTLTTDVQSAVKKTRELRQALAERAAETIHEHRRAEEAETELEVVKAGSEVMAFEYNIRQAKSGDEEALGADVDLLADEDFLDCSNPKPEPGF